MILHTSLASLLDLPLNFMLRYMIFPSFSCYATGSYLGFDVALIDLLSFLLGGAGWGGDDTTHVSCFATGSSFELHATLHDLSLVFLLRYWILPWF